MLDFPRWKIATVIFVCLFGLLAALPNVLPEQVLEKWPSFLPKSRLVLGLDLQGGSHMLLEVDKDAVISEYLADLEAQIRDALREKRIVALVETLPSREIRVRVRDASKREEAYAIIRDLAVPVAGNALFGGGAGRNFTLQREGEDGIRVIPNPAAIQDRIYNAVTQSLEIVRRRIDELGTREPTIQRQGVDRILVQVPGLQNSQQLRDLLSTTAKLTFHLVNDAADPSRPPPGYRTMVDDRGAPIVIERRVRVSGENLTDASPTFDQYGRPVVAFSFDAVGARRFAQITRDNVGKRFAIVLDDKVISAPVIQEPILGGRGQISGNFTVESAKQLAILLRAGALPAPLKILEERSVGPDLGADSIAAGERAAIIGMVLVVVFMVLVYGWFGLVADLALLANMVLILGALSILGATLTLPGIAGIVLTIGMAVDANVLIFERIREEVRLGRKPLQALEAGYGQAMSAILDANITTLIAAALLFQFGSGPVRGFAVTLGIGILTSMFTAIVLTRMVLVLWAQRRRPQQLRI